MIKSNNKENSFTNRKWKMQRGKYKCSRISLSWSFKITANIPALTKSILTIVICMEIGIHRKRKCPAYTSIPLNIIPLNKFGRKGKREIFTLTN
jgi:hypothetical protein